MKLTYICFKLPFIPYLKVIFEYNRVQSECMRYWRTYHSHLLDCSPKNKDKQG